jgi:hypothetical protein
MLFPLQVKAARAQNQPIKVGPFLKQNIVNRLRMNIPYMAKWPEALAIRAHPLVIFFSISRLTSWQQSETIIQIVLRFTDLLNS